MSNIVFSDFAGEICSHFLLFQPKKVEGSGLVHFFEETTKAKNSEIKQSNLYLDVKSQFHPQIGVELIMIRKVINANAQIIIARNKSYFVFAKMNHKIH